MKLLIILICLLGLRYAQFGRSVKRYRWFTSYAERLQRVLAFTKQPWINVTIILLPILIVTFLLQNLLAHGLFYVIEVLFEITVLWYCLWPISLEEQFKSSCELEAANDQSTNSVQDVDRVMIVDGDTRALSEALLCNANNRTFSVLFWFFILGPWGALLYRFVAQLTKLSSRPQDDLNQIARVAHMLEDILDWIPARLAGICYALAGDFAKGFSPWAHHFNGGLSSNQDLLIATGLGALNRNADEQGDIEEAKQVLQLIDRSLIIWVIGIAIFTLGSLHF